MVAGRTCGIRFVWLVGIALSVSVIGPAIAQDAGGGVEATPASGTGADQGNGGSAKGKASTAARAPIAAPPGDQASSSSRNAAAANGSSVNGTSMVRPADRTAAVGGPTKTAVGVLSGSSLTKRQ